MKIAIVSVKQANLTSGAAVRNFYVFNGCKKFFNVNYFIPKFNQNKNETILNKLKLIIQGKVPYVEYLRTSYFDQDQLDQIKKADIILFEEMESYYAFEKYLTQIKAKLIVDTHNIDYERFLSEINTKGILERLIGYLLALIIKRLEINAIKKTDLIFVCSELEKKYFLRYLPSEKIIVIPNGVNTEDYTFTKRNKSKKILFMGLLSYPPNELGIKFYIEKVHHLIKYKLPQSKLIIIGKNPPKWLEQACKLDPSIQLVGFVKDVKEYIRQSEICICPITLGSGTRLKILEYMSIGRPVVSSRKGAEGIKIANGKNILLANNETDFINLILELIRNDKLYSDIAKNGRQLIEEEYDWDKISEKIINSIKRLKLNDSKS